MLFGGLSITALLRTVKKKEEAAILVVLLKITALKPSKNLSKTTDTENIPSVYG